MVAKKGIAMSATEKKSFGNRDLFNFYRVCAVRMQFVAVSEEVFVNQLGYNKFRLALNGQSDDNARLLRWTLTKKTSETKQAAMVI